MATTTPPTLSQAGRDQALLDQIVVRQGDTPTGYAVQLIPGGDQIVGQGTLDLCGASFPSEQLRTARRQVVVLDGQENDVLETEAVLYIGASATAQAFTELKNARAHCPDSFVPLRNQPPTRWAFAPSPDATWPSVPGVERLTFDATESNQQGESKHSIRVYLRRDKVLLGIYFVQPDTPQVLIGGKRTIPDIVTEFANQIDNVPSAAIS